MKNMSLNVTRPDWLNEDEEYDPKMHCCERWYKDFCDCFTRKRQEERDRNVEGTIKFLKFYEVDFDYTKTNNVVKINDKNILLSLKTNKNFLKIKINDEWIQMSKKTFLKDFFDKEYLNSKKVKKTYKPNDKAFGKHKENTWEQVFEKDPGYILWVLKNTKDIELKNMLNEILK